MIYVIDIDGTICNDNGVAANADVICQQLGYGYAADYNGVSETSNIQETTTYGLSNDDSTKIWFDNLICDGTESKISDCNHAEWGEETNCDHDEDIWVSCGMYYILII